MTNFGARSQGHLQIEGIGDRGAVFTEAGGEGRVGLSLFDGVAEGSSGDGGLAAAGVDAFDAKVGLGQYPCEVLELGGVEESIAREDADAGVGFPRSRFAVEPLLELLDEFVPGVADGGAFFFEIGWEEYPDCAVVGFDADLSIGVWRCWSFG